MTLPSAAATLLSKPRVRAGKRQRLPTQVGILGAMQCPPPAELPARRWARHPGAGPANAPVCMEVLAQRLAILRAEQVAVAQQQHERQAGGLPPAQRVQHALCLPHAARLLKVPAADGAGRGGGGWACDRQEAAADRANVRPCGLPGRRLWCVARLRCAPAACEPATHRLKPFHTATERGQLWATGRRLVMAACVVVAERRRHMAATWTGVVVVCVREGGGARAGGRAGGRGGAACSRHAARIQSGRSPCRRAV